MVSDYSFLSKVSTTQSASDVMWSAVASDKAELYKTVVQRAMGGRMVKGVHGVDHHIHDVVRDSTKVLLKTIGQKALRFCRIVSDNYGNSFEWAVTVTMSDDLKLILNTRVNVLAAVS